MVTAASRPTSISTTVSTMPPSGRGRPPARPDPVAGRSTLGRPAGAPPLYASQHHSPQTVGPHDGLRPPGMVGPHDGTTSAINPNQPTNLAALPPEDQPEVGMTELPPNLRRQEVDFATKEPPGTIVVDTDNTYSIMCSVAAVPSATRVRVGREGFTWAGTQKITRKAEWPDWHPPAEMIERQPYLPRFMAGGRATRWAPAPCISATPCTASTAPTAFDHRQVRLVRLHRHAERRRQRPVRADQAGHALRGLAVEEAEGRGAGRGRPVRAECNAGAARNAGVGAGHRADRGAAAAGAGQHR